MIYPVRRGLIVCVGLVLFCMLGSASAFKVTVNSDFSKVQTATNYWTLDSVLNAMKNGNLTPDTLHEDTIAFTDTAQKIFVLSVELGESKGTIRFIGTQTNPSKFPVINHTDGSWGSYLSTVNTYFERLVFTGTRRFTVTGGPRTHSIKQCVIRDFTGTDLAGSFCNVDINNFTTVVIENSLFVNNKGYAPLYFNMWGGTPVVQITNCTFDGNDTAITVNQITSPTNTSIKNTIFSNNNITVSGVGKSSLIAKTTNSLTSDALSGYGTDCVSNANPVYTVSDGRTKPVDWRPTATSPARNIGSLTTEVPSVDISGSIRLDTIGKRDVGCWDVLSLNMPPIITIQPLANTTVVAGTPVIFSVTATSSVPASYTWHRVEGATIAPDTLASYTITATPAAYDGSRFYCIVSNTFGAVTSDTVHLEVTPSGPVYNPLTLLGTFVDPQHVRLSIGNFAGLPDTVSTPPYVDTIGIWYAASSYPVTLPGAAPNVIKVPLRQLLNKNTIRYDTIVQIATNPDSCMTYYFIGSAFWKNPSPLPVPAADAANGCTVFMCSQQVVLNTLTVKAFYTPIADSVRIELANLLSINRDSLSFIELTYTLSNGWLKKVKILAADLPVGIDTYVSIYKDSLFAGSQEQLTLDVRLRMILGNYSNEVSDAIQVGSMRPENLTSLVVGAVDKGAIGVAWNFQGDITALDSVRIWWSSLQEIPLVANPDSTLYLHTTRQARDSTLVLQGLQPDTKYYVGLQIKKGGVWSIIGFNTRKTATTLPETAEELINTITITSTLFDSLSNTISVRWTVDTNSVGSVDSLVTGIVWKVGVAPTNLVLPSNSVGIIDSTLEKNGENVATIRLDEDLEFGAIYHLALLLRRKKKNNWSFATDLSRDSVAVPQPKWQVVSYFEGNDTEVTAFNRQIVIRKKTGTNVSVKDTLLPFNPSPFPVGFIQAAIWGFDFRRDVQSDSVAIGIKYVESMLLGHSPDDIRMYQYNAGSMEWRLLDGCVLDTVNQIVSIDRKPFQYKDPFIIMIDTVPPAITMKSDTGSTVSPHQMVIDSVVIVDNVANSMVHFRYWDGEGKQERSNVFFCSGDIDTIQTVIEQEFVNRDNSVRAIITVSDGRFEKTVNVSRQVRSLGESDGISTPPLNWVPIATTNILDITDMETVLDEFKNSTGVWVYDSTQFRIFRWVDDGQRSDVSWREYAPRIKELFSFVPGQVLWVKTRDIITLQGSGAGKTVTLKEPFAINLNPKSVTDIGLPFRFDVYVGDILDASSADAAMRNQIRSSLRIYSWSRVSDSGTIVANNKFIAAIPGFEADTIRLTFRALGEQEVGTYTIDNISEMPIVLKIPPIPAALSVYNGVSPASALAKGKATAGWSIGVKATVKDAQISSVYCGFTPGKGKSVFPSIHSFNKQHLKVLDVEDNARYGNIVFHERKNGGFIFPIVFENNGDDNAIFSYLVEPGKGVPSEYRIALFDPQKNVLEKLTIGKSIDVPNKSSSYRWLLVGDSAFIASNSIALKVDFTFLQMFPNPFRGELQIKFSLPYDFTSRVDIAVYNQLGQRVWLKRFSKGQGLYPGGMNAFAWKPRETGFLSAGTYIVRVTRFNEMGYSAGSKQQRILYIP